MAAGAASPMLSEALEVEAILHVLVNPSSGYLADNRACAARDDRRAAGRVRRRIGRAVDLVPVPPVSIADGLG